MFYDFIGLNVNHAAFRVLDPKLGRWWSVDPDGRYLWDLSDEELILFETPEGREQIFGGRYDIELSIAERAYYFGKMFMLAAPSAKVVKLPTKILNAIPEGKLANHIFSGKAGKFVDNPANRKLISKLSNNRKYLQGTDKFGKSWYARTL
ncbi:MAG: hypothetical protein AAF960_27850, partial [Bacteroidota bacterium]